MYGWVDGWMGGWVDGWIDKYQYKDIIKIDIFNN